MGKRLKFRKRFTTRNFILGSKEGIRKESKAKKDKDKQNYLRRTFGFLVKKS